MAFTRLTGVNGTSGVELSIDTGTLHKGHSTVGLSIADQSVIVPRSNLLAALGAVDAPAEVPTNLGAVVRSIDGETFFLVDNSGDSQGWTNKDGSWYFGYEIAKLITNGGTILSEGVEQ